MNIIIDYDFINEVLNSNENYSLKKIVRNNTGRWFYVNIPTIIALEYLLIGKDCLKYIPSAIAMHFLFFFQIELLGYKLYGDVYKDKADHRLKELVRLFNKLNIETTYELIKEAKYYHKVSNLKIHNKCPQVIESKYVLLPNYDYKGDIVETSILQEHVLGTKIYTLSLGEPKQVLKLAYAKI